MYQYSISELSSGKALVRALHTTGATVVFELYDSAGDPVTLTNTACTEIATSGVFVFDLDNITTKPTVLENYQGFFKEGVTVVGYIEARAGGWVESSTTGGNPLVVTVEDASTNPIGDCGVTLWNFDQSVILGTGETNQSTGQVTFNVDAADYIITCSKAGVNFDPTYPITVAIGSNAETITGDVLTIPVPVSPDNCKIWFRESVQSGALQGQTNATLKITALPFNPSNNFRLGNDVKATYDRQTQIYAVQNKQNPD